MYNYNESKRSDVERRFESVSLKDIKCKSMRRQKCDEGDGGEQFCSEQAHQAKAHLLNTVLHINVDHLTPDINYL